MRDLRHYARQTNLRLFVGALLILFIIGDGLILLFYGKNAALAGLLCLLFALAPVFLIWIALLLIDWISKRSG
jgi:hypothetical protein